MSRTADLSRLHTTANRAGVAASFEDEAQLRWERPGSRVEGLGLLTRHPGPSDARTAPLHS